MYEVAVISSSEPLDEVLEARLDQRAEVVLRLDHERPVPERLGDAAVGGATRGLVRAVEAEPHRELEGEVRPPAREPACFRVARHGAGFYPAGSGPNHQTDLRRSAQSTEEAV